MRSFFYALFLGCIALSLTACEKENELRVDEMLVYEFLGQDVDAQTSIALIDVSADTSTTSQIAREFIRVNFPGAQLVGVKSAYGGVEAYAAARNGELITELANARFPKSDPSNGSGGSNYTTARVLFGRNDSLCVLYRSAIASESYRWFSLRDRTRQTSDFVVPDGTRGSKVWSVKYSSRENFIMEFTRWEPEVLRDICADAEAMQDRTANDDFIQLAYQSIGVGRGSLTLAPDISLGIFHNLPQAVKGRGGATPLKYEKEGVSQPVVIGATLDGRVGIFSAQATGDFDEVIHEGNALTRPVTLVTSSGVATYHLRVVTGANGDLTITGQ